MQVGPANTAGVDLQPHLALFEFRIRPLLPYQRGSGRSKDHGVHKVFLPFLALSVHFQQHISATISRELDSTQGFAVNPDLSFIS
jgi:hypothetical protein